MSEEITVSKYAKEDKDEGIKMLTVKGESADFIAYKLEKIRKLLLQGYIQGEDWTLFQKIEEGHKE